jgi:hypothetical protein
MVVPATIHLRRAGGERDEVSTGVPGAVRLRRSVSRGRLPARKGTHWRASNGVLKSKGRRGATVVIPTRTSCKKVLYFEIWVG